MSDVRQGGIGPVVSICVPCHNAERTLRGTVEALLGQTYENVDVVVVDDASTDGSREILAAFDGRIRWEAGPERGQSGAVNRAFELSRGEYIKFHDADDLMDPETVARQVVTAQANPGAVVYGPWRLVWHNDERPDGVELRQREAVPEGADVLEMHLRGWFCPPLSYLWPRCVVERLRGWDVGLHADKDADFAMRALLAGVRFVYCPNSWVDYIQHAGPRASRNKSARALRSRARVIRKVTRILAAQGRLDQYRDAIAWRYDALARTHWEHCRPTAAWCAREARRISGRPTDVGVWYYRGIRRVFGVYVAEGLAVTKRRLKRRLTDRG